jgi:hypothetical protein
MQELREAITLRRVSKCEGKYKTKTKTKKKKKKNWKDVIRTGVRRNSKCIIFILTFCTLLAVQKTSNFDRSVLL